LRPVYKIAHIVLGRHVHAGDQAPAFLCDASQKFSTCALKALLVE
jgi:hypothetical protein